jgi:hypothetical protein
MATENGSKFNKLMAILGWIVAVLSLLLNLKLYEQSSSQLLKKEEKEPKYSKSIETYNPQLLPKQILASRDSISHQFVIEHFSGEAVKGVAINIKSPDRRIVHVVISEGTIGSTIDYNDTEAVIRKSELLPDTDLKGYVVTEGITKLSMSVGADSGTEFPSQPVRQSKSAEFEWDFLIFISTIVITSIIFVILISKTFPIFRESGFIDLFKGKEDNLPLLILIIFMAISPLSMLGITFSPGEFLDGLLLYFAVTRYKLLIDVLKSLSKKDNTK